MRARLDNLRSSSLWSGPTKEEKELMKNISELLTREEAMARQRSRMTWLAEGDRNTGFFQAKAKERYRTNKIKSLRRADGTVAKDQIDLEEEARGFYQNLFKSQDDTDPTVVTNWVPLRVDDSMNDRLCTPVTDAEIEAALFMMHPDKSPELDGLTAGFYIKHWHMLKEDVCRAIRLFLEGGEMPEVVNSTVLVLIPKVKSPQDLTQYRPISLCNVLYKIASKVLALRLRPLLDDIISQEQSVFVAGRLITDNVLTAYECIHYLKRRKGKSGACAVKLDMAKAYDRVEWSYLRAIMTKLGFAEEWINIVMKCVEIVSFSVRVNGVFSEIFKPTRGIRQGDPLSPFLFLICAEGLSCMLKNYGEAHLHRGIRVGIHCPWVSHLLFVDDCLVFTQATAEGAQRLRGVLELYRMGSGQLVNKQKSAVFFSSNCANESKQVFRQGSEILSEALGEKYLGLPTALGRSTDEQFEHIPTRIKKLVAGWAPKLMNTAGREVLIKSICQAIPTYSMSCFKLSKNMCKRITNIIARYWWGGEAENKKMHWKKMVRSSDPKV